MAKRVIGKRAANLVSDNAAVIIDSGTTCLYAVEAIMTWRNLTVFINYIHVASELADWNENRVFCSLGNWSGASGLLTDTKQPICCAIILSISRSLGSVRCSKLMC